MSLNTPITHIRQPLLGPPSRARLGGALLILGGALGGAGLAAFGPETLAAGGVLAGYSPSFQTVVAQASTAQTPQPTVSVEEQRRRLLAQRISGTYHTPLEQTRKIVDSAHLSGKRHGVDPVLLLAIAAVESSFDPTAESSVGAQGLLQALPKAHPEKFARLRAEGKSPFDPAASMDLGGQIYAEYSHWYDGNRTMALQQYNGNLKDKTRRYSNKVMKAYRFLSAGLPSLPSLS